MIFRTVSPLAVAAAPAPRRSFGRSRVRIFTLLLIALLAAGCTASGAELTLIAQHDAAETSIASLRITASVAAARAQTTLDYVGTRVRFAEQRSSFLQSTLIARGTEPAFIAGQLPAAGQISIATATPRPTVISASGEQILPGVPTPPPETGSATLTGIVMATGVGPNDCALSTTSRFTPASERIYVVATASNVVSGTRLTSRWKRGMDEVASFDFVPDFDINGACIWFFIDQTDAEFTAGRWGVVLEINGVPASPEIEFTIAENG